MTTLWRKRKRYGMQRVAHIVRENAEEIVAVARCPVGKALGNLGDSLVNSLIEADHLLEVPLLFGRNGFAPEPQHTGAQGAIFRNHISESS